jgi:flagellin
MPFEISANPVAMNVYNNLAIHQSQASTALAKISSGEKAADPTLAATVGAATGLQSTLAATQTAVSSTQNAINVLQVADTAYAEATALAQQGLALANDRNVSGADTSAIDAQLTAVEAAISSIASNTQYNGTTVLGTALTATVNATGTTMTVTPDAIASVSVSGDRVADYTNAISSIVDSRAENAGNLSALQGTVQVLQSTITNQQAAIGQVLDTDVAAEMMTLTSANIMTEAATAMLAQAMQMPNTVLKLL